MRTADDIITAVTGAASVEAAQISLTGVPRALLLTKIRGSGPVKCDDPGCHGHRERCLFGRPHSWGMPWYRDGVLQQTFHCIDCGGVCTATDDWAPGELAQS